MMTVRFEVRGATFRRLEEEATKVLLGFVDDPAQEVDFAIEATGDAWDPADAWDRQGSRPPTSWRGSVHATITPRRQEREAPE